MDSEGTLTGQAYIELKYAVEGTPIYIFQSAPAEAASDAPPRRRGRPPRITEAVRKVELTPELASAAAALASVAHAGWGQS